MGLLFSLVQRNDAGIKKPDLCASISRGRDVKAAELA